MLQNVNILDKKYKICHNYICKSKKITYNMSKIKKNTKVNVKVKAKPRINLQIDETMAKMLDSIKQSYPIFGDADLLKLALNDFYLKKQKEKWETWSNSLPSINLSKEQEQNLQTSIESGFVDWDMSKFKEEMLK